MGARLQDLEDVDIQVEGAKEESVDAVAQWAKRLAGLTAGDLPGDLQAVVQRIGLLHRGRQALTTSDANDVGSAAWSCALEAVVAVVPRQLQELDVQSGGGSEERLSWADFAGYEEIVADLQRRLASVQRKLLQDSESSGVLAEAEGSAPVSEPRKTLQASALRGIVIHGPTGCGKTLLASVVAAEVRNAVACFY
jgi:hypothetical protein